MATKLEGGRGKALVARSLEEDFFFAASLSGPTIKITIYF